MSPKLREIVFRIDDPAYPSLDQAVRRGLDSLVKPRDSLGRLEDLARWYAVCRGESLPPMPRKGLVVFCGDHGVTAEGVSAFPSKVTVQMAANFAAGGAAINVLCRRLEIKPLIVDVGIGASAGDGVIDRNVARGTRNFAKEPAMTDAQRDRAIEVGIEVAEAFADRNVSLAAAGEMGIGNTTAAMALGAALTGHSPSALAGPGTGVDEEGKARKARVVEQALALHRLEDRDALRALACVGGFEIAALAGFYLGCAARRVPVVVDGFIATAAALVATRLAEALPAHLAFAHVSGEPGHRLLLAALGARPLLDLGMRLGEGSGAALGIGLVDTALALYREMATFEQARVASRTA